MGQSLYSADENAAIIGTIIGADPADMDDIVIVVRKKDGMCEFHNISKLSSDVVCELLDLHALLESVQIELLTKVHGYYHNAIGKPLENEQPKESDE